MIDHLFDPRNKEVCQIIGVDFERSEAKGYGQRRALPGQPICSAAYGRGALETASPEVFQLPLCCSSSIWCSSSTPRRCITVTPSLLSRESVPVSAFRRRCFTAGIEASSPGFEVSSTLIRLCLSNRPTRKLYGGQQQVRLTKRLRIVCPVQC
jgi:hypothetical protein